MIEVGGAVLRHAGPRGSARARTRFAGSPGRWSLDYDAAGNRLKEDKDGQPVYFWYDGANELTLKNAPAGGADRWTYFAYDENGSMLREYDQAADTTTYYEYADNGLASRIKPAAESATYFHYDARMQRHCIEFAGTPAYFAWDAMNQLEERGSDLSLTAQHTHGATPIEGIGSIIVTKRSSEYQYSHYDHRGSLFNLEDTGVSNLVAEYNAFGEELRRSGAAVTRFGYQGTSYMRLDSGLYVSPTRVPYQPEVGRFGQRDPLLVLVSRWSLGVYTMAGIFKEEHPLSREPEMRAYEIWELIRHRRLGTLAQWPSRARDVLSEGDQVLPYGYCLFAPLLSTDADGMFWGKRHAELTRDACEEFDICEGCCALIVKGNVDSDGKGPLARHYTIQYPRPPYRPSRHRNAV